MKYLKYYKLFENNLTYESLWEIITDRLLSFEDAGFNIINMEYPFSLKFDMEKIDIKIYTNLLNPIKVDAIMIEDIKSLLVEMKSIGYELLDITASKMYKCESRFCANCVSHNGGHTHFYLKNEKSEDLLDKMVNEKVSLIGIKFKLVDS